MRKVSEGNHRKFLKSTTAGTRIIMCHESFDKHLCNGKDFWSNQLTDACVVFCFLAAFGHIRDDSLMFITFLERVIYDFLHFVDASVDGDNRNETLLVIVISSQWKRNRIKAPSVTWWKSFCLTFSSHDTSRLTTKLRLASGVWTTCDEGSSWSSSRCRCSQTKCPTIGQFPSPSRSALSCNWISWETRCVEPEVVSPSESDLVGVSWPEELSRSLCAFYAVREVDGNRYRHNTRR